MTGSTGTAGLILDRDNHGHNAAAFCIDIVGQHVTGPILFISNMMTDETLVRFRLGKLYLTDFIPYHGRTHFPIVVVNSQFLDYFLFPDRL